MQITVNGQAHELEPGAMGAGLLDLLKVSPAAIVAEYNGQILTSGVFQQTPLAEGDVIELVTLVGGG